MAMLLGITVMTIGVIGIYRMPTFYLKVHAAAKSVFLGVCSILFSVIDAGDPAIMTRAVLIGLLLILTTPVAAYELARAAAREQLLIPEPDSPPAEPLPDGRDGWLRAARPRLTSRPHVEGH